MSSMQASTIVRVTVNLQRNAYERAPARQSDSENVMAHIQIITEVIEQSQHQMREFKKEIDLLRQEISLMEMHLATQNDENVKVLNPFIMANFDELTNQITLQRKENDHLQNQLIELKKDKSRLQQLIIQAKQKVAQLEDQVGM